MAAFCVHVLASCEPIATSTRHTTLLLTPPPAPPHPQPQRTCAVASTLARYSGCDITQFLNRSPSGLASVFRASAPTLNTSAAIQV
jgi:hypothetical protein